MPMEGLEWTSSHRCTSSGWGCSSHFGDEPKTHPFPLPRDFSAPFSAPKTFAPTSLTSFPNHSITKAWESSQAWVAQSFQEAWDTRLEEKKGKLLPFFTFFPLLYGFFPFFLLEKKMMTMVAAVFFNVWSEEGNGTSMPWLFSSPCLLLSPFFFYWCCCKEGDDSYCHLLQVCCCKEGNDSKLSHSFFFFFPLWSFCCKELLIVHQN